MNTEYDDLKSLILGKFVGVGIHRKTYLYKMDESMVVKCAIDCPNINILEDEIWMMVKDTGIAKWFAPCIGISNYGIFLIQKRVETRPKSEYPKFVPSFFGDLKYSNYGWIGDQFVCCDYAGFISSSMSHKWNGKMVRAYWWE